MNRKLDLSVALAQGWILDPCRPPEEMQIKKPWQKCSYWERDLKKFWLTNGYVHALAGKRTGKGDHFYSPTSDWSIAGPILEEWFPEVLAQIDTELENFTFSEEHLKPKTVYEKLGLKCGCRGEFLEILMAAYVVIAPPHMYAKENENELTA